MTGPKVPNKAKYQLPFHCSICGRDMDERASLLAAVREFDDHMADVHGIEDADE